MSRLLLLLFLVCSGLNTASATERVTLPFTLDYRLLESIVASRAFPESGNKTTLVDHGDGCIKLILSAPQISEKDGSIMLDSEIYSRVGTPLGDSCFNPIEWRGYLQVHQQPFLIPDSWQIGFKTVDSRLTGLDQKEPQIANLLLDLVLDYGLNHFNGLSIDLSPSVEDVKQFLLPLFPERFRQNGLRMLNSMHPEKLTVSQQSILFEVAAIVEEVYQPPEQLPELAPEEIDRLISLWENWDALLTYLVVTISKKTLSEGEQQILIDTLLETRYRFVETLDDNSLSHDIVREQFVAAWKRISPLFKNHLSRDDETTNPLGLLAFVSASDALLVFDRVGPTVGLEVSRDGLIRLIKMLDGDPNLLFSRPEVQPELRELFQLDPLEPERPEEAVPAEPEGSETHNSFIVPELIERIVRFFEVPSAFAAKQPTFKEILAWKVPKKDEIGRAHV